MRRSSSPPSRRPPCRRRRARGRFDGMLSHATLQNFFTTRSTLVGTSDEVRRPRRSRTCASDAMSKRKVSEIFSSMAYGPAPEAADSAKAWIESHGGAFGHFINGAFVKRRVAKPHPVDPCSGKALATTRRRERRHRRGGRRGARRVPVVERDAWPRKARATCTPWRAASTSTTGCSPCSSRWTTARRSARRATPTSPSSSATSTTTPAGRSSSTRRWRGLRPSASSAKSSRGTSRC